MKNNKILLAFLLGLVVIFIFHQIYTSAYKPISTESADFCEIVDGIKANGVVFRNEIYVSSDNSGTLHFIAEDGQRVSKGGTVAQVYDSAASSVTVSRIDEVNRKLSDIEALQKYNNVSASDLTLANEKVKKALTSVIVSGRGGNIANSAEMSDNLLSAICRRQMITGEQTDFSAQHAALSNELNSLMASLPAPSGSITAPNSGYFLSSVDGYETLLSGKSPNEITPEFLSNLKASDIPSGVIGKIVSDYEWYVACTVNLDDSLKFKEGDELTLTISGKAGSEIDVTVKAINISSENSSAVIVLSCGSLSLNLASVRTGNFTIVNKTYRGLKVRQKALHVVKGKTGVYVVNGMALKFVPIKILYTVDDYIVCEQEKSNKNVLRLYDEVVVKGKKLYDGKIVS